jgi:hypothetical protein
MVSGKTGLCGKLQGADGSCGAPPWFVSVITLLPSEARLREIASLPPHDFWRWPETKF